MNGNCHLKVLDAEDAPYAIFGYPLFMHNTLVLNYQNLSMAFENVFSGVIPGKPSDD